MSYYCGIDLHSTNHVVCVNDDEDKRLVEKRKVGVKAVLQSTKPLQRKVVIFHGSLNRSSGN